MIYDLNMPRNWVDTAIREIQYYSEHKKLMKFEMATMYTKFPDWMSFIHSAIVRVINNTRVTIQCRLIKHLHSNPPLPKLSSYGHEKKT